MKFSPERLVGLVLDQSFTFLLSNLSPLVVEYSYCAGPSGHIPQLLPRVDPEHFLFKVTEVSHSTRISRPSYSLSVDVDVATILLIIAGVIDD